MSYFYDQKEYTEEDLKFTPKEKLGMAGFFVGLILIGVLIYLAATHRDKGTIMFGVCKTFVEMTLTYPPTFNITEVEQYSRAVRLYYNYTDPFGTMKSEFVECAFQMVPGKGAQATAILLNRKDIDQATIEEFNKTIPAIVAGEPELYLPDRLGSNLEDLKD